MSEQMKIMKVVIVMLIIVSSFCMLDCAGKKPSWGNAKDGYIMSYRAKAGDSFLYGLTSDMNTDMEVMGQSMKVMVKGDQQFLLAVTEVDPKGNLSIKTTIKKMDIVANTMMGEIKPDVEPLIGKSVEMTVNPRGEVEEIRGVDELPQIRIGEMGQFIEIRDVIERFFTVLADNPMRVGETWTIIQTDSSTRQGMDFVTETESTGTLLEETKYQGETCLKFKTDYQFNLEGTGQQQGMDFNFKGEGQGNGEYRFAYMKGVLLGGEGTNTMEATVALSGGQNMTIPMTQEMKWKLEIAEQ